MNQNPLESGATKEVKLFSHHLSELTKRRGR